MGLVLILNNIQFIDNRDSLNDIRCISSLSGLPLTWQCLPYQLHLSYHLHFKKVIILILYITCCVLSPLPSHKSFSCLLSLFCYSSIIINFANRRIEERNTTAATLNHPKDKLKDKKQLHPLKIVCIS